MKYYETEKFKKLNKKWQAKLEKSGFDDQEQLLDKSSTTKQESDRVVLKTWSINFFRDRFNKTKYEAIETYYRLAGKFLHDHKFVNQTEQTIWMHHSDGLSFRKIDELVTPGKTGRAKRVVKRLATIMLTQYKEPDNDVE